MSPLIGIPSLLYVALPYVVYTLLVVCCATTAVRWKKKGRDSVTNLLLALSVLLLLCSVGVLARDVNASQRFDQDWQESLDLYDAQAYQPPSKFRDYTLQEFGASRRGGNGMLYADYAKHNGWIRISFYTNKDFVLDKGKCLTSPEESFGMPCEVVDTYDGQDLYRVSNQSNPTDQSSDFIIKVHDVTVVFVATHFSRQDVIDFLSQMKPVDKSQLKFLARPVVIFN